MYVKISMAVTKGVEIAINVSYFYYCYYDYNYYIPVVL